MGRLGAPSWGHFWHFWRPRSAKFGPKRVLEAYPHQKRDCSPNTRPRVPERHIGAQDDTQNAPRSAQDGSKRLLESNFFALENRLKFGFVLAPILIDFGSRNAPLWAPFWRPKSINKTIKNFTAPTVALRSPQDRPRPSQDPPRAPPDPPRPPQDDPRAP